MLSWTSLPYWHNKDEYSGEEVTSLLKQVYNNLSPSIAALEHEALIDSHFCISDWHRTIACMVLEVHPSYVLTCLLPNALFPGGEGFNMDDPPTPLDSYLLQCAIPEGALLQPGLVANNKDFPSHIFNR
ncbi:hypothetical protein ARMGADRAFT_1082371 [Armillaria gallica]|uniref:Uncharacterized protein n=1 Tax=Armillaria gallica TaxID=47427 RepID=A0A2H3DGQ2_ARMGA|nr:hypothetical protein ARMGADRAFT_1082371 [Armillaria gallica]